MRQVSQVELEIRVDPAGDGHYGASRDGGARSHNGIDYVCTPGVPVYSEAVGTVTKHGIVYGDDHQWRYVQVTDGGGIEHRFMYVDPTAHLGVHVDKDTIIGIAQDISIRYPDRLMLAHVHYEIKDVNGEYRDPSA